MGIRRASPTRSLRRWRVCTTLRLEARRVTYGGCVREGLSAGVVVRPPGALQRYALCGPVAGPIFACVAVVAHMYACFLEWCIPACSIEAARTYAPTTTTVS